jgi:hypothetical protein
MNQSEKICNELGKKFFSKSYVYENFKYFNDKNNRVELCDGLFEYLDIYVALQIKERNKSTQGKSNEEWLADVVYGEAVEQISETIKGIRTNAITVNDLYHQPVKLNSSYSICPIIIFDNPSITKYKRLICLENLEKTIVNVFNLADYKAMMETLVHPYDIIYYLQERASWLNQTQGLPNIALGDGDNVNIIAKIDTEEDFASFFEHFIYDGYMNKKEDALQLLSLINQFRDKQVKKCPQYKTILHILQKVEPKVATPFMERFWYAWNNACKNIIDFSKAICLLEGNKKTSIVFFSATSKLAKPDYYQMLCDAKQQQHKVDAVLLIVFIGESQTDCRIDWIYFNRPFIEEPDVLNEYIKMGLIPPEYKITMPDKE